MNRNFKMEIRLRLYISIVRDENNKPIVKYNYEESNIIPPTEVGGF